VVRSTSTTRSNSTTRVAQRGEERCPVGNAAAHHVDDEELLVQQILDPPDVPRGEGVENRSSAFSAASVAAPGKVWSFILEPFSILDHFDDDRGETADRGVRCAVSGVALGR
jgi:hypothetical protein